MEPKKVLELCDVINLLANTMQTYEVAKQTGPQTKADRELSAETWYALQNGAASALRTVALQLYGLTYGLDFVAPNDPAYANWLIAEQQKALMKLRPAAPPQAPATTTPAAPLVQEVPPTADLPLAAPAVAPPA